MTLQIKQVFLKRVLISLRFYGYYRSKCHHFSSIDHSMSVLDGYWMTLWLIIIILYSDQNTTVIFTCWTSLLSAIPSKVYSVLEYIIFDFMITGYLTSQLQVYIINVSYFSYSVRLEAGSCWENWKKRDWKHHTRRLWCRCQSLLR